MLPPRKPSFVPELSSMLRHVVPTGTSRRRSARNAFPRSAPSGWAWPSWCWAPTARSGPPRAGDLSATGRIRERKWRRAGAAHRGRAADRAGRHAGRRPSLQRGVRRPDDSPEPGRDDRVGVGQHADRADEPPLPRPACFAIGESDNVLRHVMAGETAPYGWTSRPTTPQAPSGTTRTSTASRKSKSSAACPD